jgi:ABC-type multidrug transport system fused ATPase/permease subunit
MDKEFLILAGLVLMAVIIVVSVIKRAIKLTITIIGIIIIFSLVRIFVYGVSPVEEINAYRTNIKYGKDIAQYTAKIKSSTDKIKAILEAKKYDDASIKELNEENNKLLQYQKEVQALEHTKKLNFFHENYCNYLNTIVSATDATAKIAKAGDKAIQGAEDTINKLKLGLDKLTSLELK